MSKSSFVIAMSASGLIVMVEASPFQRLLRKKVVAIRAKINQTGEIITLSAGKCQRFFSISRQLMAAMIDSAKRFW